MRWAVEASFEDGKGAVGLDQYEVRKWTDRQGDQAAHSQEKEAQAVNGNSNRPLASGLPNNQSALVRLAGAVLADQHDEWQVARRYFGAESMALLERKAVDPTPMLRGELSEPR